MFGVSVCYTSRQDLLCVGHRQTKSSDSLSSMFINLMTHNKTVQPQLSHKPTVHGDVTYHTVKQHKWNDVSLSSEQMTSIRKIDHRCAGAARRWLDLFISDTSFGGLNYPVLAVWLPQNQQSLLVWQNFLWQLGMSQSMLIIIGQFSFKIFYNIIIDANANAEGKRVLQLHLPPCSMQQDTTTGHQNNNKHLPMCNFAKCVRLL